MSIHLSRTSSKINRFSSKFLFLCDSFCISCIFAIISKFCCHCCLVYPCSANDLLCDSWLLYSISKFRYWGCSEQLIVQKFCYYTVLVILFVTYQKNIFQAIAIRWWVLRMVTLSDIKNIYLFIFLPGFV